MALISRESFMANKIATHTRWLIAERTAGAILPWVVDCLVIVDDGQSIINWLIENNITYYKAQTGIYFFYHEADALMTFLTWG